MKYMIVFKSLTHAQSALQVLKKNGVPGGLIKPPVAMGKGSCNHGVRIAEIDLTRARQALSGMHMNIIKVYLILPGGRFQEVLL